MLTRRFSLYAAMAMSVLLASMAYGSSQKTDDGYSIAAYKKLNHAALARVAHIMHEQLVKLQHENAALRGKIAKLEHGGATAAPQLVAAADPSPIANSPAAAIQAARRKRINQIKVHRMQLRQKKASIQLVSNRVQKKIEHIKKRYHDTDMSRQSEKRLLREPKEKFKEYTAQMKSLDDQISNLAPKIAAVQSSDWLPLITPTLVGHYGALADSSMARNGKVSIMLMGNAGGGVLASITGTGYRYNGIKVIVKASPRPGFHGIYRVIGRQTYQLGNRSGRAPVLTWQAKSPAIPVQNPQNQPIADSH